MTRNRVVFLQPRKARPNSCPDEQPSLLILLAAEPGELVGDNNVELSSTLNNILALLC